MEQLQIEEIDKGEVLRYLGYKPGVHALDAAVEVQIAQASAVVLAAAAVRATSVVFPLEGEKGLLNGTGLLAGKDIFAHLRGCHTAVLTALTLATGLSVKSARHRRKVHYTLQ